MSSMKREPTAEEREKIGSTTGESHNCSSKASGIDGDDHLIAKAVSPFSNFR